MCCGASRDAYRAADPAPYRPPPPAPAPPPVAPVTAGSSAPPASVRLRFLERARVRVRGPKTGVDYEFSSSEPVRAVHPGDAEALLRTGYFSRAV